MTVQWASFRMTTIGRHGTALLLATLAAASAAAPAGAQAAAPAVSALRDGQHDFDFEFGSWEVRLRRLLRPLTGSTEWAECTGLSTVQPLWDGRANIGELELACPSGALTGMSLRLYEPESRQWHIRWANASDGELGPPMTGGFDGEGRGEFYNQEEYRGRAIYVRFIFSGIAADSFRIEQAFSADGGTTWETNWITDFRKRDPRAAAPSPARRPPLRREGGA